MKLLVWAGLTASVVTAVVTTAAAPSAVGAESARAVSSAHAVTANPRTISAANYNQARSILANAGSRTAARSHPIHGQKTVPVGYGTSLLVGARDEFRQTDSNLPPGDLRSGMSVPHYNAIHSAADVMGITEW